MEDKESSFKLFTVPTNVEYAKPAFVAASVMSVNLSTQSGEGGSGIASSPALPAIIASQKD